MRPSQVANRLRQIALKAESPTPNRVIISNEIRSLMRHLAAETKFAWITSEGVHTVYAEDEDAAYEKVIAFRMQSGQTREEAEGWFTKDDRIEPMLGEIK